MLSMDCVRMLMRDLFAIAKFLFNTRGVMPAAEIIGAWRYSP